MDRSTGAASAAERWGSMVAAVAAVTWVGISLESIVRPGEHDYRDGLILLPWVLTMAAFVALHRVQRHRAGFIEKAGFWVAMAMMALTGIGALGMVIGADGLTPLAFPIGPMLWIPSMVAWGVGTARAGVMPPWVGAGLALCQPLTIGLALALSPISPVVERGSYTGALANGLVLAGLAMALYALRSGNRHLTRVAAARV
ncbi:MAG: hypothetical protein JOZ87_12515 [Chloroflexi bacterium]|nr:hypothetical protein [Chloroflexota bacterium]